jgi:hypothetical protein
MQSRAIDFRFNEQEFLTELLHGSFLRKPAKFLTELLHGSFLRKPAKFLTELLHGSLLRKPAKFFAFITPLVFVVFYV